MIVVERICKILDDYWCIHRFFIPTAYDFSHPQEVYINNNNNNDNNNNFILRERYIMVDMINLYWYGQIGLYRNNETFLNCNNYSRMFFSSVVSIWFDLYISYFYFEINRNTFSAEKAKSVSRSGCTSCALLGDFITRNNFWASTKSKLFVLKTYGSLFKKSVNNKGSSTDP